VENRELLVAYLATWLVYLVAIHCYAWWRRLCQPLVILSHAAPTTVAVSMTCIFLIGRGATVRQLTAYSEGGADLWSLWAGLWPLLLLAVFGAWISQMFWTIIICANREHRIWIPITLSGAAMCVFAFMTVIENFPST